MYLVIISYLHIIQSAICYLIVYILNASYLFDIIGSWLIL